MKKITLLATVMMLAAMGHSQTATFYFTGATQTYTVPPCVYSINVDIRGAQGGNIANLSQAPNRASGGMGGRVQATIPVTPGEVLQINVGGQGIGDSLTLSCLVANGGFNGGGNGYGGYNSYNYNAAGGGGASDIRVSPYAYANVLAVAGGGGGAACTGCTGGGVNGGPGGGLTGGNGYGGGCASGSDYGFGGTQSAGGAAGTKWGTGSAGTQGTGGSACSGGCGVTCGGGGGGGGGYYGGGGGSLGGGGGGSNYTEPSASGITNTQGYQMGDGEVIITPNGGMFFTSSQTNVPCNGSNGGSATVTITSGTPPYTYSWTPTGGTSATATGLSAGTYTVTITDSTGCSATASYTITQPTALMATADTISNVTCNGGNTGAAYVTASGGTLPYSYSWPNGATTDTVTGLSAGVYTVTVTDSAGCSSTASAMITQPAATTLSAAKDSVCINATTDALTGTPGGGTYSGTGVTGSNFNPNTAGLGVHTVKYVYTSGPCTDSAFVTIVVESCTGIDEVKNGEQVRFYPNPFSQSISVDVGINGPVNVTMFNMLGENMGNWTLHKGFNSINTQSIPSGIYHLQVKTPTGELNEKLIKVN